MRLVSSVRKADEASPSVSAETSVRLNSVAANSARRTAVILLEICAALVAVASTSPAMAFTSPRSAVSRLRSSVTMSASGGCPSPGAAPSASSRVLIWSSRARSLVLVAAASAAIPPLEIDKLGVIASACLHLSRNKRQIRFPFFQIGFCLLDGRGLDGARRRGRRRLLRRDRRNAQDAEKRKNRNQKGGKSAAPPATARPLVKHSPVAHPSAKHQPHIHAFHLLHRIRLFSACSAENHPHEARFSGVYLAFPRANHHL